MSLVLLMPMAPLLLPNRQTQIWYFQVLTILGLTGLLIFALFPSRIDRPELWPEAPIFWSWIRQCDTDGNACPSLHAAFAVYCSQAMRLGPRPWRLWSWLWCLCILLSILLVKQHRILDVLAGSILGGLAVWFFLRKKHLGSV
jgi:membrane-associated phospholipid phosphatase